MHELSRLMARDAFGCTEVSDSWDSSRRRDFIKIAEKSTNSVSYSDVVDVSYIHLLPTIFRGARLNTLNNITSSQKKALINCGIICIFMVHLLPTIFARTIDAYYLKHIT